MNLIGGYLLVLLALFAANIGLILGNYKLNNVNLIIGSVILSIITFILINLSGYLNTLLSFLIDNLSYLFLIIAIIIFGTILYYSKTDNYKLPLYAVLVTFVISTLCVSSQSSLDSFNSALYSLFVLIIFFAVYQLSKLLHYAKRQYSVIIGEYMVLFSVLTFIFALTYNSTKNLDYTMFSSFLILTPTYQLIYVIIAIVVVLVAGVLMNDFKGGNG